MVVTHGLLIRTLLPGRCAWTPPRWSQLHLANTCVGIFDAAPPCALQLLDGTRHLDAAECDSAHGLSDG